MHERMEGIVQSFSVPIFCIGWIVGLLIAGQPSWPMAAGGFVIAAFLLWGFDVKTPASVLLIALGAAFAAIRARLPSVPLDFLQHSFLLNIRLWCDATLHTSLGSTPEYSLLSGILFGGAGKFSREWKSVFIATGTMHIVAVSGSNLSFYSGWIETAAARTRLSPRARSYVLLALVCGYTVMTGAPASVVRAALMVVVVVVAPLLHRQASALHALVAAVIIMTLFQPTVVSDIGFQLSCLATLGLIITRTQAGFIAESIQTSGAASLCVMPIESLYFGRCSVVALIANAVIAPLIPLYMIAGSGLIALQGLGIPGSHLWARALGGLLTFGLWALRRIAELPGGVVYVKLNLVAVIVWYSVIGLFIVHHYRARCRR